VTLHAPRERENKNAKEKEYENDTLLLKKEKQEILF